MGPGSQIEYGVLSCFNALIMDQRTIWSTKHVDTLDEDQLL